MPELCWKSPGMVSVSSALLSLEARLHLPYTVPGDPPHPAELPEPGAGGMLCSSQIPQGWLERCSGRTGPVGMGTCGLGHRSLPRL